MTTTLTDADLDASYTHLCKTMPRLGEAQMPIFLARLALLALTRSADTASARRLVDDAAQDIPNSDYGRS